MERYKDKLLYFGSGLLAGIASTLMFVYANTHQEVKTDEPRRPRGRTAQDPCDAFPNEPICKEARKHPTEPVFTGRCFYSGSPCDEGGPMLAPSDCSGDLGFALLAETFPMPRLKGFTENGTHLDPKKFDIKAFHTLVGLIARQKGVELDPSTPLPHELDSDEQQGLAAGVAMYNSMVESAPQYLVARAERIRRDCALVSPSAEGGFKPIRCAPFEAEKCANVSFNYPGEEEFRAPAEMQNAACEATLEVLRLNGIRVKVRDLPECQSPPPPPFIAPVADSALPTSTPAPPPPAPKKDNTH